MRSLALFAVVSLGVVSGCSTIERVTFEPPQKYAKDSIYAQTALPLTPTSGDPKTVARVERS